MQGRVPTEKTRPPPAAQATLVPGEIVCDEASGERFRILSLLAEGGMGRVFRAERTDSRERCAVKCHRPIDAENKALRLRLENEGQFLKTISGKPHVCPVYGTGVRADGLSWIAMALLDGASIGQLLSVLPRFPLVWTLEIVRAVCIGLAAAAGKAIHRDIKPENVFVTRTGGIYVLDWGAGKFYGAGRLTTTGTTIGTIAFMSPEQLTDPDRITTRSDLFSTGVTFFSMLTGKHPFDTDGPLQGNPYSIAHRILQEAPRSLHALAPGLPGYVYEVALKFLEKDPAHRYRSVEEAAEVVDAALGKLTAEIGEMPPIARIFDAYDRGGGAQTGDVSGEARAVAAVPEIPATDPPPAAGDAGQSGPRPVQRTVPMTPARGAGGTIRMAGAVAPIPARPPATPAARKPAREGAPPVRTGGEDRTAFLLQVIEGLAKIDTRDSRQTLLDVLRTYDDEPILRAAAATALARVGDESCIEGLEIRTAYDLHPMVRRVAEDARAAILERIGAPDRPRLFAPLDPTPEADHEPPSEDDAGTTEAPQDGDGGEDPAELRGDGEPTTTPRSLLVRALDAHLQLRDEGRWVLYYAVYLAVGAVVFACGGASLLLVRALLRLLGLPWLLVP